MLFLCYATYFGGLYVTNPMDNWQTAFVYEETYLCVISPGMEDDTKLFDRIEATGKMDVIHLATNCGVVWNTIMGFQNGTCGFSFRNVEDFKTYCQRQGITCDFSKLKRNTAVMSRMLALNRGYSVGDVLDQKKEPDIYSGKEFELAALTEENGYFSYFISDEKDDSGISLLLTKNPMRKEEQLKLFHECNQNQDAILLMPLECQITGQFEMMDMIYAFIILLLSVVMAITVNAAFVGAYQRRTFEFAVYRAIGIPKRKLIGKLLGELIWMDLIALVGGGAVFFIFLFLFNSLVLNPSGLYLCYYHPLSLIGLGVSNIIIMLPLIITRSRQMLKADICEF